MKNEKKELVPAQPPVGEVRQAEGMSLKHKDERMELALARQVNEMSLEGMAEHFLASGYFKDISDPSKAIVKIMAGREVGIPPIASMMGLYIVEGKVTYSATTIGALIKRAGYSWVVSWTDDNGCILNFRDKNGTNLGTSSFSMADAKTAGLVGKPTWAKYPKAMMFARALSQGGRWFCPEVFSGGCYTPEELDPSIKVSEDGEVIETTATTATVTVIDPLVATRQKMIDAFEKQGVERQTIEDFCGGSVEILTADHIEKLKAVFAEVRAGHRDTNLALANVEVKPPEETPANPNDLGAGQSQFDKPKDKPKDEPKGIDVSDAGSILKAVRSKRAHVEGGFEIVTKFISLTWPGTSFNDHVNRRDDLLMVLNELESKGIPKDEVKP